MALIRTLYVAGLLVLAALEVMYPTGLPSASFHFALALIILGVGLRLGCSAVARRRPDAMVSIAWSVALYLIVAFAALLVVGMLSMGYALNDNMVVIGILGGGALVGILHGGMSALLAAKSKSSTDTAESRGAAPSAATTAGAFTQQTNSIGGANRVLPGAVGVVLGLLIAIVLAVVVLRVGSFFRGPVIGVWELGTPRYARDQRPVQFGMGLATMVIGGGFGAVLLRWPGVARGMGLGLLVGSIGMGLLLALAK